MDLLSHIIVCRRGLTGFRIERCLRGGGRSQPTVDFKWGYSNCIDRFNIECCRSREATLATAALIRPSRPFITSCTIPSFHSPCGRCSFLTSQSVQLRSERYCHLGFSSRCEHVPLSSCSNTRFATTFKSDSEHDLGA